MSAVPDPEFVDTNVFLYAVDRSAGAKQAAALDLLRTIRVIGLSVQVLQEFFVNATRKPKPPLPPDDLAAALADMSSFTVHEPGVGDVMAAVEINERHPLSFWDSMIVRSASQLGCQILWTEDLSHGEVYEGVEVRSPFT